MLVVISPAKKMNMKHTNDIVSTKPEFSHNVEELIGIVRKLNIQDLQNLMGLSINLAKLNIERFINFGNQEKKAAALAFAGDTYQGLDVNSFSKDDMIWAQSHLSILSGLYGLLRPLDEIEPYRLEMGSNLKNKKGNTLYSYWGDELSTALDALAKKTSAKVIVNCASKEYFNAVNMKVLSTKVITPVFMERREGKVKIVSFFAKKARGAMARYIIQKRLTDQKDLKRFDFGGYKYQENNSDKEEYSFIRDYPAS